jgi:hypothetical protein
MFFGSSGADLRSMSDDYETLLRVASAGLHVFNAWIVLDAGEGKRQIAVVRAFSLRFVSLGGRLCQAAPVVRVCLFQISWSSDIAQRRGAWQRHRLFSWYLTF